MVALNPAFGQLPLIEFVESDDLFFEDQPDVLWFDVLRNLDDRQFQSPAARYYEQLWLFNQQQAQQRNSRLDNRPASNPETHKQATERLLFARPTLDDNASVLYDPPHPERPSIHIRPESLRPGVTPPRFAGRPPKCFFALLKAFLGVTLAKQPAEPEFVRDKLQENPAFARTCGFTMPRPGKPDRQSDIPSLRKLQQFDQIMTANGLWGELALDRVAANLREGNIKTESTLVHDTTHYHAYSTMRVIELPGQSATTKESTGPASDDSGIFSGTPSTSGDEGPSASRLECPPTSAAGTSSPAAGANSQTSRPMAAQTSGTNQYDLSRPPDGNLPCTGAEFVLEEMTTAPSPVSPRSAQGRVLGHLGENAPPHELPFVAPAAATECVTINAAAVIRLTAQHCGSPSLTLVVVARVGRQHCAKQSLGKGDEM